MYGESDVYIYPTEVWKYVQINKKDFEDKSVIIAENLRYGKEIVLETDKTGGIIIAVYCDDVLVESERIVSQEDATETCRKYYSKYLAGPSYDETDELQADENPELDPSIDEKISEREDEIQNTFMDFLDVVLYDTFDQVSNDEFDQMLDDILDIISSYGYDIYRPCYLENEDGTVSYTEYPYGEYEADESAEQIETTSGNRVEIHP